MQVEVVGTVLGKCPSRPGMHLSVSFLRLAGQWIGVQTAVVGSGASAKDGWAAR